MQRYRVVGGVAGWVLPLLTGALAFWALAEGEWDLAVAAVLAGGAANAVVRGLVVEVAPAGLTRGFVLRGAFLGRTTVLPWRAIAEVHTAWRRPHDDSALETSVRGHDGTTICFSTVMGLRAYWACLADVARGAPGARRSGVTEAALADAPPARRDVLSATAVAAVLALLLVALVGVHYIWAQGRSYLSRYLEHSQGLTEPTRDGCDESAGGRC